MQLLKELSIIIGGTTAAVFAIAWLAKSLTAHLLSKDITSHKAALDAQYRLEIERLKAELTKKTLEHEIKYRRVDEKVAEVLEEVYRLLIQFYGSVQDYVSFFELSEGPTKSEILDIVCERCKEFGDNFVLNKIHIPPNLFESIKKFSDKLAEIAENFSDGREKEEKGIPSETGHWSQAFHALKDEAKPLFNKIVQDVQHRLGVHDSREIDSDDPS